MNPTDRAYLDWLTAQQLLKRCDAEINYGGRGSGRCLHKKKVGGNFCKLHDGRILAGADGRMRSFVLSMRQWEVLRRWAAAEDLRSRSEALRNILDRLADDMYIPADAPPSSAGEAAPGGESAGSDEE